MFIYYLLFGIPVIFSLYKPRVKWSINISLIISTLYILFIGLREEIGVDWDKYQKIVSDYQFPSYIEIFKTTTDPLYFVLNKFFQNFDGGIYYVNSFCALIFISSLILFLNDLKRPFLGLSIAFPYLIVVIGSNYTRQSVAIGLSLLTIKFIRKEKFLNAIFVSFFALGFHISGIFGLFYFIPFLFKFLKERIDLLLLFFVVLFVFFISLIPLVRYLFIQYFGISYISSGFYFRSLVYSISGTIFLFNKERFTQNLAEKSLISFLTFFTYFLLIIGIIFPSKTALLDRVGLYLTPLHLIVASSLPSIKIKQINPTYITIFIHISSLMLMFIWLNFSPHKEYWIPYKNLIF